MQSSYPHEYVEPTIRGYANLGQPMAPTAEEEKYRPAPWVNSPMRREENYEVHISPLALGYKLYVGCVEIAVEDLDTALEVVRLYIVRRTVLTARIGAAVTKEEFTAILAELLRDARGATTPSMLK